MTDWKDLDEKGYLSSLYLLDREDDRRLDFHGAFIPQVAESLILRHTKPGEWVWDCFAGSGTTGIEAERLGRRCFMTDLNPRPPVYYKADAGTATFICTTHHTPMLLTHEQYAHLVMEDKLDDASRFLFDLVIMHPPYHSIIQFSEDPRDLSNCKTLGRFLRVWEDTCVNVALHVKPGGIVGLVIGDIWLTEKQAKADGAGFPSGVFSLGFECMARLQYALGEDPAKSASIKSIVVKDINNNRHRANLKNLWKSRYARWGAVEFAHEYIISIQKGK